MSTDYTVEKPGNFGLHGLSTDSTQRNDEELKPGTRPVLV